MENQTTQAELETLQESLEAQRRQTLALILELQDDGAGLEATEKPRMKLSIINQEMTRTTAQVSELKRRRNMSFETPEKMQAIAQTLKKTVSPEVKEAMKARDEAETKVQILVARAAKFEIQKAELTGEISHLNQEITRVLHEGGDPGEINRQMRAKIQESEDLQIWMGQLNKDAIPAAEKVLADAKIELWSSLLKAVNKVRPSFDKELSDFLAQASELSDSWRVVVHSLFREYGTGRGPSGYVASLIVDPKRTSFFGGLQMQ